MPKKRRWFSIPDRFDRIGFSTEDNWNFPTGMVWVKHFDMELERGNPASARRLETRFLVKTDSGSYGLTYRWNEEQTDAELVNPATGMTETLSIDLGGGEMFEQEWLYPSNNDCMQCHTDVGGHALSFNTRQLNKINTYGSETVNQLIALNRAGYFAENIGPIGGMPAVAPADDLTATLEHRVKSYLDVNCVQCHQPGGPAGSAWDARYSTPMADAEIINGALANDGGNQDARVIVPGSLTNSVLLHRIQATGGFSRMPPLATYQLDQTGIALLTEWISSLGAGGGTTFSDWIAGYPGVGARTALSDDADNDGNKNALENFFGTDPSIPSQGITSHTFVDENTFTFIHPQNKTPASDLSATYTWSKDLENFYIDGDSDGEGTTVNFTTQIDTPEPHLTTVTANLSGTPTDRIFIRIEVTER